MVEAGSGAVNPGRVKGGEGVSIFGHLRRDLLGQTKSYRGVTASLGAKEAGVCLLGNRNCGDDCRYKI